MNFKSRLLRYLLLFYIASEYDTRKIIDVAMNKNHKGKLLRVTLDFLYLTSVVLSGPA